MGYYRAGFTEIVGVDINSQKRYPFEFVQGDALEYVAIHGQEFDVIHASPPCQAYSISKNNGYHQDAPKLIPLVRKLLRRSNKIYIIENVYGAPLEAAIQLCGASFGLGVSGLDLNRHRYFECSLFFLSPPCQHMRGKTIGVYGNGTNSWHKKKLGRCVTIEEMRKAMGIDWMIRKELSQAVPPAYTEWLGKEILKLI